MMSKTIDNIKCGNYEVVDNQGVSVTGHFTQCLEKEFADMEAKLAEKEEKNLLLYSILYETLEKEYSENVSSRINQMTGETLEKQSEWFKSNRICDELQKQLAEKEKEKDYYQDLYFNAVKKQERTNKVVEQFQQRVKYFSEQDQDKISFAIAELEKVNEHFVNIKTPTLGVIRRAEIVMYIDNQIKQLKEGN